MSTGSDDSAGPVAASITSQLLKVARLTDPDLIFGMLGAAQRKPPPESASFHQLPNDLFPHWGGPAAAERLGVAHQKGPMLGSGQQDIGSVLGVEKTRPTIRIAPHQGHYRHLALFACKWQSSVKAAPLTHNPFLAMQALRLA